jgi:hypothetical protein
MIKHRYFLFCMVALLVQSCQPAAIFDKPQPADVAALSAFPKRIQGKYLSQDDGSQLQITARSAIRIYDFYEKSHVSQLDSNQQIIGDTLFDLKTNKGELIQIEGEIDTLFTIDDVNILKKFKGYYFMNIYMPPNTWQVKEMEFKRGRLKLSSISPKEDVEQLKTLTETAQDTMPYVFSPTRKQFKKFVRNEGFRDVEAFMKIQE